VEPAAAGAGRRHLILVWVLVILTGLAALFYWLKAR
jgi:hypothetical protein